MNAARTMHLFVLGCGIGCILFSIFVKMGNVASVDPSKWFIPLNLGVVFLIWEWLVNKR